MTVRATYRLRRKKWLRVLILFFFILSLVSLILPTATAENTNEKEAPDPIEQIITTDYITINVYDDGQPSIAEANVGPGDLRTVFFKGFVEQDPWGPGQNIEQVIVMLRARVDEVGWSAMVNPPMISFQYVSQLRFTQTRDFSVSVLAPFRAPYREESITVTVMGEWMTAPTNSGGPLTENPVKITVTQFPDLLLDSLDVMKQVSPGQSTDFVLQIHNRGNNYDDFTIEFINDDSLTSAGWAVELRGPTVIEDIPPWHYKNVTIRVHAPQKFTIWKNQVTEIIVKVQSVSSVGSHYEKFGEKDFSFFLYERGVYFPPEQTICSVTGLIILVVVVVLVRKRRYAKMEKEMKNDLVKKGED